MSLLELFCHVDDFCQSMTQSNPVFLPATAGQRRRQPSLTSSERMTLMIHFHQSSYQHFKAYYTEHVQVHLKREFLRLVSYNRFVQLLPWVTLLLCMVKDSTPYRKLIVCLPHDLTL
jgi:hypothetical protein